MSDTWKLPGYVIEALVGSGGAADVWRARAARSGDVVALKRVRSRDEAQLASLRAEAALLSALDHPNLVRVHEFVQHADTAVLVLDFAAGGSLAKLIESRGRLAPGEVITALAPIGAALASAHEAAVVHGDVSAGNVLFTSDGHPLLSDLGVARLLGDGGPVFGTPGYLDPAVAAGAPPGPQSDVFMLAGVALHALTGTPTWPDSDADDALAGARAGVIDEAVERLVAADVPVPMQAVLLRALSADPQRRGTAAEFALDLRHSARPVAVELGVTCRPSSASPGSPRHAVAPPTRRVAPRVRPTLPSRRQPLARRKGVLIAATAVGAAALGLGAVAWSPWHRSDQAAAITPVGIASLPTDPAALTGTAPDPWVAALDALDARRAQAYERRDAALLDSIYADPALRAADEKTLARLVPRGCGLLDVRSTFTAVQHVESTDTRAVLLVTARLADARLVCSGEPRSTTPASPPTRLRIELVRSARGVRIGRQQMISPSPTS